MQKFLFFLMVPIMLLAYDWTVLVYMAADNGLAQWADSDLVEMEQVGSNDDIAVLVQVDKPNIGAKRLFVGEGASYLLRDLGITDMCSWETLYDFLYWGMNFYPAKKYFVILWDHGTGWTSMPKKSFGSDWSSGNTLSIANGDLQRAISNTYNSTGQTINLFAFDACLMQQIEVAFEIENYAKVFLAPQTIMPLQGFRYDEILEALDTNPGINEIELAKIVVQQVVDNYSSVQPVAISAINVKKIRALKENFVELTDFLIDAAPNPALLDLRTTVQTIPAIGYIPSSTDDYIDFGDFIMGMHNILACPETGELINSYDNAIVKLGYWGDAFENTTGLTIWFPDKYQQFKQLLNYYVDLDWTQSRWLEFLNWFYGTDDIRPANVDIFSTDVKSSNDFRLFWNKSFDLAPITYNLIEAQDTSLIFQDACEDSNFWNLNGFALSSTIYHSGNYAFFSGNTANLQNYIETSDPLVIEELGMLSIFLNYNTEDMTDSLIIQYGPFIDVHYGYSSGWVERTTILPAGNHRLRISYHTNSAINLGGCYVDDIYIYRLNKGKILRRNYPDTTIYIFNKLRGVYHYTLFAEDRYDNKSNLSNLINVSVQNFALPYSNPNPFQSSCDIVLDYPDILNPTVEIYSLSGIRIKKFDSSSIINKTIHWDGKDGKNRDVASGIYFILIKGGSFKKIGKIARQR